MPTALKKNHSSSPTTNSDSHRNHDRSINSDEINNDAKLSPKYNP